MHSEQLQQKKQNDLATAMAIIALLFSFFYVSDGAYTPVVTTTTDATGHIMTTYSARAKGAYFSRESTTVNVS